MNSPVEICEGGFIISTSFLIRLESLGLMIAPLAHILDRKLAMTGWWFESNGLFDPLAFWMFNLANYASISNFDGYSLKMVSLGELEDAEKPDNSVLPEHFVEHEHLKDNFIRMKPLVKGTQFFKNLSFNKTTRTDLRVHCRATRTLHQKLAPKAARFPDNSPECLF